MITLDMQRIESLLERNAKTNRDPCNWTALARVTNTSASRLWTLRRTPTTVNVTLEFVDKISRALRCKSKSILTEDPNKQKGRR